MQRQTCQLSCISQETHTLKRDLAHNFSNLTHCRLSFTQLCCLLGAQLPSVAAHCSYWSLQLLLALVVSALNCCISATALLCCCNVSNTGLNRRSSALVLSARTGDPKIRCLWINNRGLWTIIIRPFVPSGCTRMLSNALCILYCIIIYHVKFCKFIAVACIKSRQVDLHR